MPLLIHATALAFGDDAVLLRGASGTGKSDLALRCLTTELGPMFRHRFTLIADDQVLLTVGAEGLVAACPPVLAGLLEVRGVGIVRVEAASPRPVRLVVDLVGAAAVPRLPEDGECIEITGISVRTLRLDPWPASAPAKLALALSGRAATDGADQPAPPRD